MFNSLNNHYDGQALDTVIETLSREHDNSTAREQMRKYCMQTSSENLMKKGMEFLHFYGYYKDLHILIQKNKESDKPSNKHWAEVYQMISQTQKHYSPHLILRQAESFKTDEPELKFLIEYIKITSYFDLKQYNQLGNFLEEHQHHLNAIEDRLLASYFETRIYQILVSYYLLRNELIMSRKFAYRLLNLTQNDRTKINLHIKLGLSYTFESHFQGMNHLQKALEIAKKHNLTNQVKAIQHNNIPFLSAHFSEIENVTTEDKSEQAHLEIARGNHEKAISILDEIPIDSPFKLYYLGRARKDKSTLLESYNAFIEERSDYFFSRLPLNALKQMD
ncbi:AimR family lysis-lysogeny pheromone receptor [Virgibacillus ainsalahensis]